MDPLSVTASAVALVQASHAIVKAIRFLYSLQDIPDAVIALFNELTDVHAVIKQVKYALDSLRAAGIGVGSGAAAAIDADMLGVVETQAKSLEQAAKELNTLCARLQPNVGKETSTREQLNGQRKGKETGRTLQNVRQISVWLREKRKIDLIHARIESSKKRLALCLEVLNTVLLSEQICTIDRIHQNTEMVFDSIVQVQTGAQTTQVSLSRMETAVSRNTAAIGEMMRSFHRAQTARTACSTGLMANRTWSAQETQPSLPPRTNPPPHHNLPRDQLQHNPASAANSIYVVQTVIRQRTCPTSCRCQCHHLASIDSGRSAIFGSIFLQYSSIPVMGARPCSIKSCLGSAKSLQLQYIFPSWLMARAVHIAASWGDLTGRGSDLHLHIPRVLRRDIRLEAEHAISTGDVAWFKTAIARKSISPTDIDQEGANLITIALLYNGLQVAFFLFQQGFMTKGADSSGFTVARSARWKYCGWDQYDPHTRSMLRAMVLCSDEGDAPRATPVHDIVMGIRDAPLAPALEDARADINSLDDSGWTPMHWAIRTHNLCALRAMLDRPECNIDARDSAGLSLLHFAARDEPKGSTAMARLLLDAGANVNTPSQLGNPICLALHNHEMVRLLLDRGSEVSVMVERRGGGKDIVTPIHSFVLLPNEPVDQATVDDWDKTLALLVQAGAALDQADRHGLTALIRSVVTWNSAKVSLLVKHGARLDHAKFNTKGRSILHYAARFADLHCINTLRDAQLKGIDPDAVDSNGWTPMDCLIKVIEWPGRKPPHSLLRRKALKALLDEIRLRNAADSDKSRILEADEETSEDEFFDAVEAL